jgi:hypothetical protein
LYQEQILEHSKASRNYRELKVADRKAEGYNPLCGDRFRVYFANARGLHFKTSLFRVRVRHLQGIGIHDDAKP